MKTISGGAWPYLLCRGLRAGTVRRSAIRDDRADPIRTGVERLTFSAFRLENSASARKHLPETMAGGVAAFDYDGDGLTDIYFTNGAAIPSLEKKGPKYWNRFVPEPGRIAL